MPRVCSVELFSSLVGNLELVLLERWRLVIRHDGMKRFRPIYNGEYLAFVTAMVVSLRCVGIEYIGLLIGLLIVWLGSMHILSFPLGFSLTSTYIGKPFRWLRVSLVTDQSRFSSTAAIMLHAGGVLLLIHQVTLKFLCMQQTVQVTVSLVIVRANVLEFATKCVPQ